MSETTNGARIQPPFAVTQAGGIPLHAVWYQVLQPRAVVGPQGQVSYDLAGTVESADAAFVLATRLPAGAVIIQNNAIRGAPPPAPASPIKRA
jgi:hypothetical protein